MDPYQQHQQHYAAGWGAPPPQQQQQQQYPQRQYSSNQLPPMQGSFQQPMAPGYPAGPAYHMPPPPPPPLFPSAQPAPQPVLTPGSSVQPPPARPLEESRVDATGRYRYALKVEQQPLRARMCGFGDKDRRPITPPPCVRLVITDERTGKPAQLEQSDGMFFVLQVDLWSEDASKEVNIVRSSSSSPAVSISTATTTSYPPPPERHHDLRQFHGPQGPQWMYEPMSSIPGGPQNPLQYHPMAMGQPLPPAAFAPQPPTNSSTMFTRNLIGSLTVNAAWLKDNEGNYGFWFVLQDLSVRTEGFFR